MADIKGNTQGLKPHHRKQLTKLFERKAGRTEVITPELARTLCGLSREMGRQIALIIDRRGSVESVIVGDAKGIMIGELSRYRVGRSRFRGVRLVHTHLNDEPLTQDDLTDLALLRFDCMAALQVQDNGLPGLIHLAWLTPHTADQLPSRGFPAPDPWYTESLPFHKLELNVLALVEGLEQEFARQSESAQVGKRRRRAILVGVTTGRTENLKISMNELKELADSAGLEIVDVLTQRCHSINPKYVVGNGKIKELIITAMQMGADLIVFEGELTGSQMRAMSELSELEVIDRTQLILDIFAQRAHSRDGKLQVELAQMKYSLPRLVLKDDCLSRITGGIGAKGPGETKIEVLRRRVKERITKLEEELERISGQRRLRRNRRNASSLPVLNLVGYTNAGKSTLLRTLTGADILVEDRLFATLDPTSRRLNLPSGREIILTDTVGFIQDLPQDLARAFRATLEELNDADLLVHVVDVSNPRYADQIMAVQEILEELALDSLPQLLLFNKIDALAPEALREALTTWPSAIPVSALKRNTLLSFLNSADQALQMTCPLPAQNCFRYHINELNSEGSQG